MVEHEELFDLLRKHGEEIINNKSIKVAGSGQWKNFQVVCCESGEILIEKAMVKVMTSTENIDIDAESLVELQALQQEMFNDE